MKIKIESKQVINKGQTNTMSTPIATVNGKEMNEEEFFAWYAEQQAENTRMILQHRPDLANRTCPWCEGKYDGYGNNPAPIPINGQVCDQCNALVVQARMAESNWSPKGYKAMLRNLKKKNQGSRK
jgi:hypothetical protein